MTTLQPRLRAALTDAMRGRDPVAVRALRSALGAIDNAEAVDETRAPRADSGSIAGAAVGLGAGDVPRRQLSEEEVVAIVQREVGERDGAAAEYDTLGKSDEAARLRREASVLRDLL